MRNLDYNCELTAHLPYIPAYVPTKAALSAGAIGTMKKLLYMFKISPSFSNLHCSVFRCLHCKGERDHPSDSEHSARRGCVRREEGVCRGELSVCLSVCLSHCLSPRLSVECAQGIYGIKFFMWGHPVCENQMQSVNNEVVNCPIDFVVNQVNTTNGNGVQRTRKYGHTQMHMHACSHTHTHKQGRCI